MVYILERDLFSSIDGIPVGGNIDSKALNGTKIFRTHCKMDPIACPAYNGSDKSCRTDTNLAFTEGAQGSLEKGVGTKVIYCGKVPQ